MDTLPLRLVITEQLGLQGLSLSGGYQFGDIVYAMGCVTSPTREIRR